MARRQAVINDPELLLDDDDRFMPSGRDLVVLAEWAPGLPAVFSTLRQLIAARTIYEQQANVITDLRQRQIAAPGCAMYGGMLGPAFGRLFSADEFRAREIEGGAPREVVERTAVRIGQADERGWVYGWWIAPYATEGWWAAQHRHRLTGISRASYQEARARLKVDDAPLRFVR